LTVLFSFQGSTVPEGGCAEPSGRSAARGTEAPAQRFGSGRAVACDLEAEAESRQVRQVPPRGRRSTDRTTRACGTLTTAQCKRVTHLEQVASVIWERVCL